jgi:hypothetical protein
VTAIDDEAFADCDALAFISLPSSLRSSIDVEKIFCDCPGRPTWRTPDASTAPTRTAKRQRR